jgi:hypothetical protein
MGSSPEEQRIAVHAAARGVSEPMLDEVLGIGAMADRDYRSAAQRFARAEPHALQVDRLRCWRVLALGLAGDTSGAAALLEQAGPRMQHSAEPDAQWEWLANRFGLQQPLETKPR